MPQVMSAMTTICSRLTHTIRVKKPCESGSGSMDSSCLTTHTMKPYTTMSSGKSQSHSTEQ